MWKEIQERSRTKGSQSYSTCNLKLGFIHRNFRYDRHFWVLVALPSFYFTHSILDNLSCRLSNVLCRSSRILGSMKSYLAPSPGFLWLQIVSMPDMFYRSYRNYFWIGIVCIVFVFPLKNLLRAIIHNTFSIREIIIHLLAIWTWLGDITSRRDIGLIYSKW